MQLELALGLASAALVVGFFLGSWVANRWIDHRWYCGRRHRANHRCRPSLEHIERWRRWEEQLDRAEDLEDEARWLRTLQ